MPLLPPQAEVYAAGLKESTRNRDEPNEPQRKSGLRLAPGGEEGVSRSSRNRMEKVQREPASNSALLISDSAECLRHLLCGRLDSDPLRD